jgi:hypothetical protein
MASIEKIFEKYNFLTRDSNPDIPISEIEDIVGFLLPSDYKDFLLKFKQYEGVLGPEYVQLWDIENLIAINKSYDILNNLKHTIGIGTNLGGELIAIENFDLEKYRIVLTPFIDLDKNYHNQIGDSFSDFLTRLDNGVAWFSDSE